MTAISQGCYLLAYGIALYYWARVRTDYARESTMRLALGLLCASCICSLARHGAEFAGSLYGWNRDDLTTLRSLRQIPIALALVSLIAALIFMWRSFRAIGLGIRVRKSDVFWMAVIMVLIAPILLGRENMLDARSSYALIRFTQAASPLLLAVPALLGIVLHRVSREMQGGFLAASLRFLVASLVLRLLSLAIFLWPGWGGTAPRFVAVAIPILASYLFAIAAWHHWRMTVHGAELSRRYRDDPAGLFEQISTRMIA